MEEARLKLMYRVARDYYQRNLTQQEIANKFGISRIMVSRLLARSIDEKIVEIRLHIPDDPIFDVERKLEEKFGLREAIVVQCPSDDYDRVLDCLGEAAGEYLLRILQENETISVSWGKTLLAMVNNMRKSNFPETRITQMIGGLGYPEEDMSGTELVRRLANMLNAKARLLNSPGIVRTSEICRALKAEPQVNHTLKIARNADIALVGIGSFSSDSIFRKTDVFFTEEDNEYLDKMGAVGDISLRFFDAEGNFIDGAVNERVVGLTVDEIREIPRVVGIAGGSHKRSTIGAALKTGLLSVLITDKEIAGILLNE